MCYVSHVTSHLLHIIWHMSPVTCHLTVTLCGFSCYESPRRFGDATNGGLVIDRVNLTQGFFGHFFFWHFKEIPPRLEVSVPLQSKSYTEGADKQQTNRRTKKLIK